MADVFISYVEEDSEVAAALSEALEDKGYSTWCYERHSVPGPSYLAQTRDAIGESRVFMLVLSKSSLTSIQIEKEVVRAHETGKRFLPVLRGVTHAEFQTRQPEWAQAAGGATGINLRDGGGVGEIIPRIVRGLQMLHVEPDGQTGVLAPVAPPVPVAPRVTIAPPVTVEPPAASESVSEVGRLVVVTRPQLGPSPIPKRKLPRFSIPIGIGLLVASLAIYWVTDSSNQERLKREAAVQEAARQETARQETA